MRYNYQTKQNLEENVEETNFSPDSLYSSQENAFIKYVTQLDAIPGVVDNKFLRRFARRVLFSGKIKALSFISNPKTIKLNSCMRNNMSLCEDAGLEELADETVFDNIDVCTVTRGTRGNLQYALITQKREFKDTSDKEKKRGLLGRIVKNQEEQPEPDMEGY